VNKPAHNGETHTVCPASRTGQQTTGNAVGSPLPGDRYGPVTTDPFGERRRSLSHPFVRVGMWQIYDRRNTRALNMGGSIFRRT